MAAQEPRESSKVLTTSPWTPALDATFPSLPIMPAAAAPSPFSGFCCLTRPLGAGPRESMAGWIQGTHTIQRATHNRQRNPCGTMGTGHWDSTVGWGSACSIAAWCSMSLTYQEAHAGCDKRHQATQELEAGLDVVLRAAPGRLVYDFRNIELLSFR